MRMETVIYQNEGMKTLETLLQQANENNEVCWFEIYSEVEDILYAFKIDKGLVREEYVDEYNSLLDNHKSHIVKEYAITACNFQAILKREEI